MTAHKGWAWGSRIPETSLWLTIPGSHYRDPTLTAVPEDATPYPSNLLGSTPVLALVEREAHDIFRIIELVEEAS
jgi:hypothetical protein